MGRTKYPAFWLILRQLFVVLPLVAIAGAAGQTLLTVQILVISVLARVPYRVFRLRLWILGYHRNACPDAAAFRPVRSYDWAAGIAATAEVLPIQLIGIFLWLFVTPSPQATLEFIGAVIVAVVSTSAISTAFAPVLAHYYFDNRPDLRHLLAMAGTLILGVGVLLYAPTSIVTLPAFVQTVLEYLPWSPLLFLPLSIGVAPVNLVSLGVSALLTTILTLVWWRMGRNARTDLVDWEPDYDSEDDDEM